MADLPKGTEADPRDNVRVVLHEPQDLVNVAAIVRAMSNMGLQDLTLVDALEFDPWRITGIAHHTDPIVDRVIHSESLQAATAEAIYVVGTSARPRTAQRNYARPRDLAPKILRQAATGPVAIVFGREDRGLSNEALDRCHDVIVVPTASEYRSLNLAQAFLIVAYELLLASGLDQPPFKAGKRSVGPARQEELEETYDALEEGLAKIEFFRSRKVDSVMRILRTALARASLDGHEARLLRAIGYEMRNFVNRLKG